MKRKRGGGQKTSIGNRRAGESWAGEQRSSRRELTWREVLCHIHQERGEMDKVDSSKKRNTRKLQYPILYEDWLEKESEGVPESPTLLAILSSIPPPQPLVPNTMTNHMYDI